MQVGEAVNHLDSKPGTIYDTVVDEDGNTWHFELEPGDEDILDVVEPILRDYYNRYI